MHRTGEVWETLLACAVAAALVIGITWLAVRVAVDHAPNKIIITCVTKAGQECP